uniref:hypothetical protein n=1 Tax=Borrelia duttonii TaxID=40834 RepID=UPI0002EC81EA
MNVEGIKGKEELWKEEENRKGRIERVKGIVMMVVMGCNSGRVKGEGRGLSGAMMEVGRISLKLSKTQKNQKQKINEWIN